jgi:hypothetical protein
MQGPEAEYVAFTEPQVSELGFADARGIRQYGLEHRLQIAGQAGDDTKNLRRRRLLLQCVGKVLTCHG